MDSSTPRNQLTYFSERVGVVCKWGPPTVTDANLVQTGGEKSRGFRYSNNGKYLAIIGDSTIKIYVAATLQEKVVIAVHSPEAYFSPLGTYLVTCSRPDNETDNLCVWNVDEGGKLVQGFKFRQQLTPSIIQWTSDELVAGVMLQVGKVNFYTGSRLNNPIQTVTTAGARQFSIAPGNSPYKVGLYVPMRGSTPGLVALYNYPHLTNPVIKKTFFADSVQFLWNSTGTHVLILSTTDIDRTGSSYYGKSGVFLLALNGKIDARVTDEDIHDVQWNPNGNEFAVIYGAMPADVKISTFDTKGTKTADLAEADNPRNRLIYDPTGRIIAVGGFGSLSGDVDFWDVSSTQVRKVGGMNAYTTTFHEFCPDGRHFLAAILSPRLRQDNGIRIYNFHGELVHSENVDELFHVYWRPHPPGVYPQAAITVAPGGVARAQKVEKPKVYRHPHYTGASSVAKAPPKPGPTKYSASGLATRGPVGGRLVGEGTGPVGGTIKSSGPVGGTIKSSGPVGGAGRGAGGNSTNSNPNKNKRRRKKGGRGGGAEGAADGGDEDDDEADGGVSSSSSQSVTSSSSQSVTSSSSQSVTSSSAQSVTTTSTSEPATEGDDVPDQEKRKRNVKQKLQEIDKLKERLGKGDKLNAAQHAKISREDQLKEELAQLEPSE